MMRSFPFPKYLLIISSIFTLFSCQTKVKVVLNQNLTSDWYIQSSSLAHAGGDQISTNSFDTEGWHKTEVPTTVLGVLVKDGVYQDIYFGRNLENITTEPFESAWWYRKEFQIKQTSEFENAIITFNGINYSANIWLNGELIASRDTLLGAFRQFEIDITDHIRKGNNVLAAEVFPPEPGDFAIGFVDWNPRPPDKNMGIWREVKLLLNKGVSIKYPHIRTQLNTATFEEASLHVSMDLINTTDRTVEGKIKLTV